jgi:hypothetical protein
MLILGVYDSYRIPISTKFRLLDMFCNYCTVQ